MYENTLKEDPDFSARLTSEIPMKKDTSPEEVAEKVIWLCSDESSYITGLSLPVDGGRSIV